MTQLTRHCTLHRPKRRYHITDEDFLDIGGDLGNASISRILEQLTDSRINSVCATFNIPEGVFPPEELLWIDEREVPSRELEKRCLKVRSKSTLARSLNEHDPRSLIKLGLVKLRYVARPATDHVSPLSRIRGLIQRDMYGSFIVVDDVEGRYEHEGALYSAIEDGYSWVSKQYLYDFDEINAKIAKLDGHVAPKPLPRWQQKSVPAVSQETSQTKPAKNGHAKGNTKVSTSIEGGYSLAPGAAVVFDKQNTTRTGTVSIGANNGTTQHASWCVETLLSLIACVLAVPPKPSDSVALAAWLRDWQEPAVWLLHATEDLDPSRAWAHIERQIRGMSKGGPTWHAKKGVVITLRHVVGWDKDLLHNEGELRLTGRNWQAIRDELDKAGNWWPDETTRYDGPALLIEESPAMPSIIAEEPQEPPFIAEEPVAVWGMTRIAAQSLCDEIRAMYPRLSLTFGPVGDKRYFVCVEVAKERWHDLASADEWRDPSPETQAAIEQALAFVGGPSSTDSDGEEDEATPTTEPLDHVALPLMIDEPSLPTSLVPLVVPPQPKTGMSLFVAQALLRQIVATGFVAELRRQGEERAQVRVETAPGAWQLFDSSTQWQRWRASSMPPPGSIGAIAAQAIGRAGMRSQAVRP